MTSVRVTPELNAFSMRTPAYWRGTDGCLDLRIPSSTGRIIRAKKWHRFRFLPADPILRVPQNNVKK